MILRAGIAMVAARALIVAATIAGGTAVVVPNPVSGLRTWEVGAGDRPLVLLHGYAATPKDWLPFTETIRVSSRRRFVFPEAPEPTTPPDGPIGGRGWWRLDMSQPRPAGLPRAAERVRRLLDEVRQRLASDQHQLILGGFSQGAMVSADIAFRSDEPLRALVLLSAAPVDEAAWIAGMSHRRGLPVFLAHGRHDEVLPFTGAIRLEGEMRRAGLRVMWVPFDGGHEIPVPVVTALNRFLAMVDDAPAPRPSGR